MENENYICQFCKKCCKNKMSLSQHIRFCKDNPEHIDSPFREYNIKHTAWNKGLTEETDKRLKRKGETLRKKFKNGEIIPFWKNKQHSDETKQKISESMKRAQKEGRAYNIGQSRWNNEHSRPEKWLINVLKNEFNQTKYQWNSIVISYKIWFKPYM